MCGIAGSARGATLSSRDQLAARPAWCVFVLLRWYEVMNGRAGK
jgi:hypothetical protein